MYRNHNLHPDEGQMHWKLTELIEKDERRVSAWVVSGILKARSVIPLAVGVGGPDR